MSGSLTHSLEGHMQETITQSILVTQDHQEPTPEGKGTPHPGRGRPSPWLPEPLRPGKTQNAGATESALLWRTRKLELHSTQGPLHIEQPGA